MGLLINDGLLGGQSAFECSNPGGLWRPQDNYEELWLLKRTIARGTPPAALLCKAGLRHLLP